MNTDEYAALHFPHDPPDPSPRLPQQTDYSIRGLGETIPDKVIGLFVMAYSGTKVVGFLGPFVGMYQIDSMIFHILRALRALGADAYEIVRKE